MNEVLNDNAVVVLSLGDWAKVVGALIVASAVAQDRSAAMECDVLAVEIRKQCVGEA